MKIALVTYQDNGHYHSLSANEDAMLVNFLSQQGLNLEKVIWNDKTINWKDYDLAILKSPWDYFNFIDDFYRWLDQLKLAKVKLLNPIDIVKRNADKHYLNDIALAGLNVTPSVFLTKGNEISLNNYFSEFNTTQFILKPCVSGGAKNTFKINASNVLEVDAKLSELIKTEDFIVQPFLNEIAENGEWSVVFFGGKFSHALLKKAKTGDFRVQPMFGGTVHPQQPTDDLIIAAKQYVDQFAKDCLYARVDGTFVDDKFILMELELIEPFLFLDTNENALENYYRALKRLI